jgi:hypothetical protein
MCGVVCLALLDLAFCCCCCMRRPRGRHQPTDLDLDMPTNPPKPNFPRRTPISLQPRNEQTQSPFFSRNFPAELRVVIYEAVLGDSSRLTHIIPFNDGSGYVGRRRCEEPSFSGPTWQHKCFGAYQSNDRARWGTFDSDDNLLSIILSCHRMYVSLTRILNRSFH